MLQAIFYTCSALAVSAFVMAAASERRGRRRYRSSLPFTRPAESQQLEHMVCDPHEAAELFQQIQRDMARTFGFLPTSSISAKLAPHWEIDRKMGAPLGIGFFLGLCSVEEEQITIYVARGLPKPLFYAVLAHEYAHVWQRMEGMCRRDFEKTEGFAEWVSFVLTGKAGFKTDELFDRTTWDPYGTGMRRFKAFQDLYGTRGAVEVARQHGSPFRLMRGNYGA
ncbi:MAG: hypothetical protein ABIH23_13070 [bacterium]